MIYIYIYDIIKPYLGICVNNYIYIYYYMYIMYAQHCNHLQAIYGRKII